MVNYHASTVHTAYLYSISISELFMANRASNNYLITSRFYGIRTYATHSDATFAVSVTLTFID